MAELTEAIGRGNSAKFASLKSKSTAKIFSAASKILKQRGLRASAFPGWLHLKGQSPSKNLEGDSPFLFNLEGPSMNRARAMPAHLTNMASRSVSLMPIKAVFGVQLLGDPI